MQMLKRSCGESGLEPDETETGSASTVWAQHVERTLGQLNGVTRFGGEHGGKTARARGFPHPISQISKRGGGRLW